MTAGPSTEPYPLARFVTAQEGVFDRALDELAKGRKHGHWMGFVFPQLRGLGQSDLSWVYGLTSLAEARAYLAHPLLGARLRQAVLAATRAPAGSVTQLFGSPDHLKFRSCLTLFDRAAVAEDLVFVRAMDRWRLEPDPLTLKRLGSKTEPRPR